METEQQMEQDILGSPMKHKTSKKGDLAKATGRVDSDCFSIVLGSSELRIRSDEKWGRVQDFANAINEAIIHAHNTVIEKCRAELIELMCSSPESGFNLDPDNREDIVR